MPQQGSVSTCAGSRSIHTGIRVMKAALAPPQVYPARWRRTGWNDGGARNVERHVNGGSMTRLVRGPAVALLMFPWCFGQPPRLPVKRVVLYKNGVGYFEHVGQVRGNQEVTIPF